MATIPCDRVSEKIESDHFELPRKLTSLPPASAVEVIQLGLSFCVFCLSVCLSVSTLMAKLLDLWPQFLVWELTLTLARVGIVGQGSRSRPRSQSQKMLFTGFCPKGIPMWNHYGQWWDFTWCHSMMSLCVSQSITKKDFWPKGL